MPIKILEPVTEPFKVVSRQTPEELEEAVNNLLKLGWDLNGETFAHCDQVCQSMAFLL